MKKILTAFLALVMALAFCGCNLTNYKTATELLDSGEFEAAREMFAALGDYEDSAAMITECDYQQAIALLKSGEFETAREMFLALGDYKDSKKLSVNAAWGMLHAYVQAQDEFVYNGADSKVTVINTHENALCLTYQYNVSGMLKIDVEIGIVVDTADGRAMLSGIETTSSYAAHYDASGGADWDFSTYKSGDKLEWETFEVEGTTAQNTPYTQDLTLLDMLLTAAVKQMVTHFEQMLCDSNLGLTMADLGFHAYE